MNLEQRLRAYAANRSNSISQPDADLIVSRTVARESRRVSWSRHGFNAAAALVVSVIILLGGVVFGLQMRSLRLGPANPSPGPLPPVPNEIVQLDSVTQDPSQVTPFRLRDGKILPPQLRWIVAPGKGLMIDSAGICDLTTIHIVDFGSPPRDTQPVVSLKGCYGTPTLVPNSTLILLDHQEGTGTSARDLGAVAYDWAAGHVTRTYPEIFLGFSGGLVSADGSLLYAINSTSQNTSLSIANLRTGQAVARIDVQIFGINGGGMALSPDGRTLYVNEGIWVRSFDALTGSAGPVMEFKAGPKKSASRIPAWLSAWLPSPIEAAAKEGFEANHGIAVDPKGHWIAALGVEDNADIQGIWVFDTAGHLIRHIETTSTSGRFRGLAFSLDGTVIYALVGQAQQGALDIIDPHSGRSRALGNVRFSDLPGIAGVEPAP